MKSLEEKDKELLGKLKEAAAPQNFFTLTFKINDVVVQERVFPADKYSLETLSETRTHFLMNDLIREVIKAYSETEEKSQEEIKKAQMEQMWKDIEQNKK